MRLPLLESSATQAPKHQSTEQTLLLHTATPASHNLRQIFRSPTSRSLVLELSQIRLLHYPYLLKDVDCCNLHSKTYTGVIYSVCSAIC